MRESEHRPHTAIQLAIKPHCCPHLITTTRAMLQSTATRLTMYRSQYIRCMDTMMRLRVLQSWLNLIWLLLDRRWVSWVKVRSHRRWLTEYFFSPNLSQDGAVNVYTIEEGQYVRTIHPLGCSGPTVEITYLALSYQGRPLLHLTNCSACEVIYILDFRSYRVLGTWW